MFIEFVYSGVRLELPNRGRLKIGHFSIYQAKVWYVFYFGLINCQTVVKIFSCTNVL